MYMQDLTGAILLSNNYPDKIGQYSDYFPAEWREKVSRRPKEIGVKRLRGGHTYDKEFIDKFNKSFIQHAVRWAEFDHPNVARCIGYAFDFGPMPAIVMEHYKRGNLMDYMKAKSTSFEEKLGLVGDIARGLNYLHTLDPPVVHGDLRAANVFVDNERHAVIADYELVHIIGPQDFTSYKPAGTARWIAPELTLAEDDYDGPKYSKASDIFALAMTIMEVVTGEVPFASKKQDIAVMRLISEGKRPDLPVEISRHGWFKELVEKCWDRNPNLRPTARDIEDALNKVAQPPSQTWYSYYFSQILGYFLHY
ncbi:hypothetical protein AX15_004557 [Amanita polypyramis BW_CC]|nr:hypothetical protein AX15_004557 [Amanita polypyramis BW_CC]